MYVRCKSERKFPTLGKPPVLTRSGLIYGFFFETIDFATSSTLVTPVVGVVALGAVVVSVSAVVLAVGVVSVSAVALTVGCVASWEMEVGARDGDED